MTAGVALFVINSLIIGQTNELADEIWELTCEGNSCLSGKDQSKLDEMKKNFTKSPAPPAPSLCLLLFNLLFFRAAVALSVQRKQ